MPLPALKTIIAPVLACALVTACSSMTDGSGVARQPNPRPTDSQTTEPTDSAVPTDTTASSSAPSAPPPASQAPPAQCPNTSSCQPLASANLGSGFVIMLRSGAPSSSSPGSSVIELVNNGVPVYWYAVDGEEPASLTCHAGVAVPNCIVVDYLGAHSSNATVWALSNGSLHRGDTVQIDTPTAFGRDLNGDGMLDVIGLQNNYEPDYATGKVQWQTWTSDTKYLTSTGCTPLKTAPPAPRPTTPAAGTCAAL